MTKIGANFDWQFQLPMEVGVLTTANFVGSWPIGVETKIGANRNWQCQLPTQIGSNQTANLKVAVVIFHNFLCAIIQA